jgi:hypothetical protein
MAAFRKYYGPTMNAFDAAEKGGRATDLQSELQALFDSQNKSFCMLAMLGDASQTEVSAEFSPSSPTAGATPAAQSGADSYDY